MSHEKIMSNLARETFVLESAYTPCNTLIILELLSLHDIHKHTYTSNACSNIGYGHPP